jgi:hypothetical protein
MFDCFTRHHYHHRANINQYQKPQPHDGNCGGSVITDQLFHLDSTNSQS